MRRKKDSLYDKQDDEAEEDYVKHLPKCPKCEHTVIDQCKCGCNSEKFCMKCGHKWH